MQNNNGQQNPATMIAIMNLDIEIPMTSVDYEDLSKLMTERSAELLKLEFAEAIVSELTRKINVKRVDYEDLSKLMAERSAELLKLESAEATVSELTTKINVKIEEIRNRIDIREQLYLVLARNKSVISNELKILYR